MKKEMVDDINCSKPQPWLMFRSEPCITKDNRDKGVGLCSAVTDLVEKKGAWPSALNTNPQYPNCNLSTWQETKVRRGRTIANGGVSDMYLYIKRVVIEEKFKSEFLKIWVISTSGERDMSSFQLKSTNKRKSEKKISSIKE